MNELIATDIKTETFNLLLRHLKKQGWKITAEYDAFDKGIDFDFYELRSGDNTICLGWCNWFEGEMKANKIVIGELEKALSLKFKFGTPEHLNGDVREKYKLLIKVR